MTYKSWTSIHEQKKIAPHSAFEDPSVAPVIFEDDNNSMNNEFRLYIHLNIETRG